MRILVTGGQGFIGSHLVQYLLEHGHTVVSLDRSNHGNLDAFDKAYDSLLLTDAEITKMTKDSWLGIFRADKIEGVLHLAGLLGTAELTDQLRSALEVNVLAVLPLYDAIADWGIPAVQIAVGNPTWHNTYSITKTTTERIALMYNDIHGTKIAVVRAMNVYGPRQKWAPVRKIVPFFTMRALTNEVIEVFGNGDQRVDLIHVDDTVKILAGALMEDHGIYNRVFDCGSGFAVKVSEVAEMIKGYAESDSLIMRVPMRNGEPLNSFTCADLSSMPAFIEPDGFIDLKRGLKSTVLWYARNHSELQPATR